jgi:hypothetical protein
VDLFDYKPTLQKFDGIDAPDSLYKGERFAFITGRPKMGGSPFSFKQYGKSGAWFSEVLPNLAKHADELTFLKGMQTTQFNHGPAQVYMNTGNQNQGRPSFGAWLSYGIGSENKDLPAYVVLLSGNSNPDGGSACYGSGFLPTVHQGVPFQKRGDPINFVSNPAGVSRDTRHRSIDLINQMNEANLKQAGDPETLTRIAQYELAYRMQSSVPELTDLSKEPAATFEMYGPDARTPGTYAANCILARRLAERGVRFIQLYHMGWDHHEGVPRQLPPQCMDTDQPSAALIQDLKQRGMLDDTLVVWGGEFGRTAYCQGKLQKNDYGRDHHPRCFSIWLAGGGVKGGLTHGATDEFSYNVVENPVSVHDLHATLLHLLGMNYDNLFYDRNGLKERLTGVIDARVVKEILA